MRVAAIIVAGGKGERVGAALPKQFLDLGGGRTMLSMSIRAFLDCPEVDELIVAVPAGFTDRVLPAARVQVLEGGRRRQDSMALAFARIGDSVDVVLVHDAARPFVSTKVIGDTIAAAKRHGAAIAAVPVRDTVKRVTFAGESRVIRETLPREEIFLAQTPQGFRRDVLAHALEAAAGHDVTDEAMLVERAGIPVHVVDGDPANLKITTPEDLMTARTTPLRIGNGYDLHRLLPGRPLILAGVRIPFDLGLHGHSDADIVCHAVTDAILGASALGDIGRLFPDTDPAWKNADSVLLLKSAVAAVKGHGFAIVNVDVTVIAERPKLLPYLAQMRTNIAGALGVAVGAVSIKGKTNETVDATGRGEAMACYATALLSHG